MEKVKAIFLRACPNCGRAISDVRLREGSVCVKCLERKIAYKQERDVEKIYNALRKNNRLESYGEIYNFYDAVKRIEEFFKQTTGVLPWSSQLAWMKRIIRGESFSIVASTGMGKTTFCLVAALYFALQGKKCYLVFPTSVLVEQASEKIRNFAEKINASLSILSYSAKSKNKNEIKKKIASGNFDIFLSSTQFLARNFQILGDKRFDFIFVDDADSLLRSSRNIERVIKLLGFTDKAMEVAYRIAQERVRGNEAVVRKLERRIEKMKQDHGILIVSSATGRAKGKKIVLYRELLDFEIGSSAESLRNVQDAYTHGDIVRIVKELGRGGLVFVSQELGLEKAKEICKRLRTEGVRCGVVHAQDKSGIEKLRDGELDVLVGVASYYGVLVRGLDFPHIIRYAVFYGVPKFRFSLSLENPTIYSVIAILDLLADVLEGNEKEIAQGLALKLRRAVSRIPVEVIRAIERNESSERYSGLSKLFSQATDFVRKVMASQNVVEKLASHEYANVVKEQDRLFVEIPDVRTYIQASGRTSRLYAGGITRGLSVVVVDNEKLFHALMAGLRWRYPEAKFVEFEKLKLDKLLKEIDEDREKVRRILEGRADIKGTRELVKIALMIVESPNKAKTIANFFGKPSKRKYGKLVAYEVSTGKLLLTIVATVGHVFDLVTRIGKDGVFVNSRFVPVYDTLKKTARGEQFVDQLSLENAENDKLETLKSIVKLAQEVDEVYIATDPDVEGEKIAWDVSLFLRPYITKIYRTEFHEVTRHAIEEAIEKKRALNEKLVEAQIVRRIEDRWLGFGLSRFLQRHFRKKGLSAGRVQTPVLGWIINRTEKHKKSLSKFTRLILENGLEIVIRGIVDAQHVTVRSVHVETRELKPRAPYVTHSMIRDASAILGFSASYTMKLAQELFESALITYHRTDSTRVSLTGIAIAKQYIGDKFGRKMFVGRRWQTSSGGAHECIRPTRAVDGRHLERLIAENIITPAVRITKHHLLLYDMIFKRFVASQMKPAKVKIQKAILQCGNEQVEIENFIEIVEAGWMQLYPTKLVQELKAGQELRVVKHETFSAHTIPLYTEGEVVEEMQKRGIGRPSTYAQIISVLLRRGYVIKKGKYLFATRLGSFVHAFLVRRFPKMVSEERTRRLEQEMRYVEEGKMHYQDVLKKIYNELRREAIIF